MKTKYYILADGEGTRWHNYRDVPKHLIGIDDEAKKIIDEYLG